MIAGRAAFYLVFGLAADGRIGGGEGLTQRAEDERERTASGWLAGPIVDG